MAKASTSTPAAGMGPIGRLFQFFRDARDELKKVHRPTREETIQVTWVVLLMLISFSVFLGLADLVFGSLMQWLLSK